MINLYTFSDSSTAAGQVTELYNWLSEYATPFFDEIKINTTTNTTIDFFEGGVLLMQIYCVVNFLHGKIWYKKNAQAPTWTARNFQGASGFKYAAATGKGFMLLNSGSLLDGIYVSKDNNGQAVIAMADIGTSSIGRRQMIAARPKTYGYSELLEQSSGNTYLDLFFRPAQYTSLTPVVVNTGIDYTYASGADFSVCENMFICSYSATSRGIEVYKMNLNDKSYITNGYIAIAE